MIIWKIFNKLISFGFIFLLYKYKLYFYPIHINNDNFRLFTFISKLMNNNNLHILQEKQSLLKILYCAQNIKNSEYYELLI